MSPDDLVHHLIERTKAGDSVAFETLARRVHPLLFRWALSWTGDSHDADDVAQEALVKMHQHIDRYAGRGAFDTWLYQIARNAAADLHRTRSRERRTVEALEDMTQLEAVDGPDDLESSEAVDLVRTFLVDLSARQREVFDLCDLQGFAPSEVAKLLGLEPATVRVHLLRARSVIRSRILAHHPDLAENHGS